MNHAQHFLSLVSYGLICFAYVAIVFYAPFAKTWFRALAVPFILVFSWSIVRLICILNFDENSPPGIYFLIVPFEYLIFASITRGIKLLLFQIPFLKSAEEKIRFHFRK
jgi:hypothetical protein